jgi:ABC-type glycerol-3-phosphate transport system substrate-binding protein
LTHAAGLGIAVSGLGALLDALGPSSALANAPAAAIGPTSLSGPAVTDLTLGSWGFTSPMLDAVQTVIASYQRKYKNTVRWDQVPQATYLAASIARIRSNTLQDIVMELNGATYAPLYPALRKLTDADLGTLKKELIGWPLAQLDPTKPRSPYFGVPIGSISIMFYYNKAAFAKANLPTSHGPRTWAEFLNAAKALKAAGITPMGIDGANNLLSFSWWQALQNQFYPDPKLPAYFGNGKLKITDKPMFNSLNYLYYTYAKGWWGNEWQSKTFGAGNADFIAGKIGMIPGFLGATGWDAAMGQNGYGIFVFPKIPTAPSKSPIIPLGIREILSISKQSQHPKEAMQFIRYFAGHQSQSIQLRKGKGFPNRSDIDVLAITQSKNQAQILKYLAQYPAFTNPIAYFKGGALGLVFQKLAQSVAGNQLVEFLEECQKLQEQS